MQLAYRHNVLCCICTGTYDYDNYFGKLASNNANYARLWLTDSGWDDLAVEVGVTQMSLPNTWSVLLAYTPKAFTSV